MDLASLDTPVIVVDLDQMERNIGVRAGTVEQEFQVAARGRTA